jgi:hypothetical protein
MYLSNPLSLQERLSCTRLFDHDNLHVLCWAKDMLDLVHILVEDGLFQELEERKALIYKSVDWVLHTNNVMRINSDLAEDILAFESMESSSGYARMLRVMGNSLERGGIISEGDVSSEFRTVEPLLYCTLFNLVKNGVRAQRKVNIEKEKVPVRLCAELYSGVPAACFVPAGAEQYDRFVRFSVQDCGKGFSSDVSFEKLFCGEPPKKWKHGFGLYFVGLAARVLRAPIGIESVAGNTKVSLYHPIFPA